MNINQQYINVNGGDEKEVEQFYTVEEAINTIGWGSFNRRAFVMCGLVWSADAMEVMLLSFLMPVLKEEWDLRNGEDGLLGSVLFLGMFFGAFGFGILSDKYGRIPCYRLCVASIGVFGLLSAASPNFFFFLCARIGVGMGAAGTHVSYSLFMEFTPTNTRAIALLLNQGWWTIGVVFGTGLAWLVLPTQGWRPLLIYNAIPSLILLPLANFLPESPRYLQVQDRSSEAQAVLETVARLNGKVLTGSLAKLQLNEAHENHEGEQNRLGSESRVSKCRKVWESYSMLWSSELWSLTALMYVIWAMVCFSYYGRFIIISPLSSLLSLNFSCYISISS